ncbi:MAG: hypothetical protein CME06_01495 [Gemmatimonadetes bacterium]|nr:hypothetical protein [Gemmatimonadota bacterium]
MQLVLIDPAQTDRELISIDGIAPRGPNFSHRDGNRTPDDYRADTAAGIIARLIDDRPAYSRLASAHDEIAATRYSPGAVLAVALFLRPDLATAHDELILEAATAAEYECLNSEDGVRVALVLQGWADQPPPELREMLDQKPSALAKEQLRFEYALESLPRLLDQPSSFSEYWLRPLKQTRAWLDRFRERRHRIASRDLDLDFVHVISDGPVDRRALRTVSWESRTLVSERMTFGWDHVFTYELESYFDIESVEPPDRHDLAPLVRRLEKIDGTGWRADTDISQPIVRLTSGPRRSDLEPNDLARVVIPFLEKADGLDIPRTRARLRVASTPFRAR